MTLTPAIRRRASRRMRRSAVRYLAESWSAAPVDACLTLALFAFVAGMALFAR